jgi:hypothetical protein
LDSSDGAGLFVRLMTIQRGRNGYGEETLESRIETMAYMRCDYLGSSPRRYAVGCTEDADLTRCKQTGSSGGRKSAAGLDLSSPAVRYPFEKLAMALGNIEDQEGLQEAKQDLPSLCCRNWNP